MFFASRRCCAHVDLSCLGSRTEWRAASGIRAMALAHDAASLNAIAAQSALASRAWVHEKLGRSDVEVSCMCPLLCSCIFCDCVSFAYISMRNVYAMLGIPGQWKRAAESRKKRCSDSPGNWWPARSASLAKSTKGAQMLLCEEYAHRSNGRTS